MKCKDGDIYGLIEVLERASELSPLKMVAVAPYDCATLHALREACDKGIISPILVGDERKIKEGAEKYGISLDMFSIAGCEENLAPVVSAEMILQKKASFIMKGLVGTGNFIHVLLDPRYKIRTERILSHVSMFEIPETKRVFLISDAAINILPNFTRKIHIVANAVDVARKIGITNIKVAMLAAVEKIRLPAMPSTLDAFLMKKFSGTGFFGPCYVDGPFAFDNALDPEKAKTKGIGGKVAGMANIIIVPNIETGNVIYKSITCLQKRPAAGVVMGGSCPIVVPSRSDDYKTKLFSIQFARLLMMKM